MPETPDLKALAERYLDLWEEQFSAAAADPALAAAMAAWLGPWRALAAGVGGAPGAPPAGSAARPNSDERATGAFRAARPKAAGATAGTAAAGAASGDGGRGLERVLEQLDRIERRLDALERKRAGKGGGARAGARGDRSRGAR